MAAVPTGMGLVGCSLLVLTGYGEGGAGRHRRLVEAPDFDADPSAIQVKAARLRPTPGGCEVDVTFTNVSVKPVSAGFRYEILDAAGRPVTSRDTAVRQAAPGQTVTVSSEGTTAGPSGVPCPAGGRPRLTDTAVLNF